MELLVVASAGTLESSDIQIIIEPNDSNGITIELESVVKSQFGEQIENVIKETLNELNIDNAKIFANDKGAIDPVIKVEFKLQYIVQQNQAITNGYRRGKYEIKTFNVICTW